MAAAIHLWASLSLIRLETVFHWAALCVATNTPIAIAARDGFAMWAGRALRRLGNAIWRKSRVAARDQLAREAAGTIAPGGRYRRT